MTQHYLTGNPASVTWMTQAIKNGLLRERWARPNKREPSAWKGSLSCLTTVTGSWPETHAALDLRMRENLFRSRVENNMAMDDPIATKHIPTTPQLATQLNIAFVSHACGTFQPLIFKARPLVWVSDAVASLSRRGNFNAAQQIVLQLHPQTAYRDFQDLCRMRAVSAALR